MKMTKDRDKSYITMRLLNIGQKYLPGYKKLIRNWVFEIKLDLMRKAIFVEGGQLTDPPQSINCNSVVSIYSVNILLNKTLLNFLDVNLYNIGTPYINMDTYFIYGKYFGPKL